jgi:hypothetical protein
MEAITATLDLPLLGKKYVMSSLQLTLPCEDIETCQRTYGPPKITFAADISGSMIENMETLRDSLYGLIDMAGKGTILRVVAFDESARTLIEEELQGEEHLRKIKDKLAYSLINWDRGTNLEVAISHCLSSSLVPKSSSTKPDNYSDESYPSSDPQSFSEESHAETLLVFASDGVANIGREKSSELIEYARSFPSYVNHTMFTLGIRTNQSGDLNSDLLKDMALDSGGIFQLTETKEGIAKILGDVFAHHYFYRYLIQIPVCTSANGCIGQMKTSMGLKGAKLRADKPLTWIWEFPLTAEGPFTLSFTSIKRTTTVVISESLPLQTNKATELQAFIILGCVLVTPALDKTLTLDQVKHNHDLLSQCIHLTGFQSLTPLQHSLQLCIDMFGSRVENPDASLQSYTMSSGGGEDSIQVQELRSSAVQFSQAQGIVEDTEPLDSQSTVLSESTKETSNKRLKTM